MRCEGVGNRVHVRWILAPLGINVNVSIAESWGGEDLVFNYASSDDTIPTSNVLQILESPVEGDETDLPKQVIENQEDREGLIWLLRKAKPWEDVIDKTYIDHFNTTNTRQIETPSVEELLQAEYFLSYDPYTFYSFVAAMVGTVSVVFQMPDVDKREDWERTTFVGVYLQQFGGHIPGIAYGISPEEIDYARTTKSQVREFLFQVKAWGLSTVSLVLRDALRYGRGERVEFEGARFVKDVY